MADVTLAMTDGLAPYETMPNGGFGYEEPIREAAGRDSNALDAGSQSLIVGFHEDRFGSTPNSGRGWDLASRRAYDPKPTCERRGLPP
jgi:hypothetical protein